VQPQANIHRADRTPPVKVLALQGDYHSHDSDVFPMLEAYCKVIHTTCINCQHALGGCWNGVACQEAYQMHSYIGHLPH
jgi:hypothetical protein